MTCLSLFYSYLLKYPCLKLIHTALIPCTITVVIDMDSDPIEFWRKMKQNIPILKNYLHLNMSFFNIWENLGSDKPVWSEGIYDSSSNDTSSTTTLRLKFSSNGHFVERSLRRVQLCQIHLPLSPPTPNHIMRWTYAPSTNVQVWTYAFCSCNITHKLLKWLLVLMAPLVLRQSSFSNYSLSAF